MIIHRVLVKFYDFGKMIKGCTLYDLFFFLSSLSA